jgi:hypothetical protein
MPTGEPMNCYNCPYRFSPLEFKSQYYVSPHLCPVCNGKKKVPNGFYNFDGYSSTTDATPHICQTCNGEGIIWR